MSIVSESMEEKRERDNSRYVLTIPGNIDPGRRDYRTFFRTIKKHLPDYRNRLHIQLLGSPSGDHGKAITRECDFLASKGWNIEYFSDWIPVSKFESRLGESDIIVAPMKKTKQTSSVVERYGVSKGSGCFLDAIRFLCPVIVPSHYQVPPEVSKLTKQYSSPEDLANTITSIIKRQNYLEDVRIYSLKKYNIRRQSSRLNKILTSVL